MLDPQTYRASEQLAKASIPTWRVSQIHNVDHFERVGFPVRLTSAREIGQIIDTMQENRFEKYMQELGGLSESEYRLILNACADIVRFQLTYLPQRNPLLPISTLLSSYALYKKMMGADPNFGSVLEIGPGCGYLSFFLRHHEALQNYSQIEACESFYILQNLVNLHCFGARHNERALPLVGGTNIDYFVNTRPDMELSPAVRLDTIPPLSTHYPWWRIGELISREASFDIVTSNANLLEFNPPALDDYLTLMHRVLKPGGIFLVQCTGFTASGTVEQLLDKIYEKRFAPLMFVRENDPARFTAGEGRSGLVSQLSDGAADTVIFTTNNAVFVKPGHPLFEKYYNRRNYHLHFIAPEPIVREIFYARPAGRRFYTKADFLEPTEKALQSAGAWGRGA